MAIEGLEIAPNGIGSGLAQVADTRFTQAAFLKNQEQKRLQKAKEEEELAKSLASIDVDGIHTPDTSYINQGYSNVINQFGKVRNAKTREDRLREMAIYEQTKKDLLFDIANSKQRNKDIASSIGDIGPENDEYQVEYLKKARVTPTKEFNFDRMELIPPPKPVDLNKMIEDIVNASVTEADTKIYQGKVGEIEGIYLENGKYVSPKVLSDKFITKISNDRKFAKGLLNKYKYDYEKEKKVVVTENSYNDVLNYAIQKEFEMAKELHDKNKKSFSQKGNGGMVYNTPGQGTKTSVNFDEPYAGDIDFTTVTKRQTPEGDAVTTTKTKVPVINAYPATVKWESNLVSGAINSKNKWIKGTKSQLSLASSDFVILPVVVREDGSMTAVGIFSETTSKVGGQSTTGKDTHKKLTKGKDYQFRVFAMASDGMDGYQVPAESIPYNKMTSEAQAALKAAQEEAIRLNGGAQQTGTIPGGDI